MYEVRPTLMGFHSNCMIYFLCVWCTYGCLFVCIYVSIDGVGSVIVLSSD